MPRIGAPVAALTLVALASGPATAETRALNLRSIEGDYYVRFRNELVGGEKYMAKDWLRIVRHGDKAAYFSVALEFYNGHECSLSGIAALQGDALVYRAPDEPDYDCRLEIRVEKSKFVFSDEGNRCRRLTCGARGGYGGKSFPLAARRVLKNAAALRRSEEFREALDTFEKLPKGDGHKPAGTP